ncbi:MAG TPA: type II secretion system F family protein, partial [Phycisphaerales bacterium]|nr:type II secretion system F family protein [Phycisphaerales bacterium]
GHATREQLAWTLTQLSIMIETRMRLSDALDCLVRQTKRPRLKQLLDTLSKSIQGGRPLSEAMEMYPRSFPPSVTALIRASEMSGTMSKVLSRCSEYLMRDLQLVRRMKAAMVYPLMMFVLCITVAGFLLTVILPKFAAIFSSHGATLPWPTRTLMGINAELVRHGIWWALALVVVGAGVTIWSRSMHGRRQLDTLRLSTPLLSRCYRLLYQGRTFRTMALLINSGVPILDVIQIAQEIVSNVHYQDLWKQVQHDVERGARLAGPLIQSRLIDESVSQMIDNGDRCGQLGFVLSRLADHIEEEYDRSVRTFTQFIEPAMIVLMGTFVGFVVASMMLPLFQAAGVIAK